jgi:hypothetical protein
MPFQGCITARQDEDCGFDGPAAPAHGLGRYARSSGFLHRLEGR